MKNVTETTLFTYLLDVENNNSGPIELNRSLEAYYRALGCSLITITYLPINGKEYCIIADDEALLKENPKISAISKDFCPMLAGSLLITGAEADENEDFSSLTSTDIAAIEECIKFVVQNKEVHPVIVIG